MTPGTLIYPSAGVLSQGTEFNDNRPIRNAFRTAPDTINVTMMSGQEETYTIKPDTLQSEGPGIVSFTDSDGEQSQIRPIEDIDGLWLSGLHIAVPASALRSLVVDANPKEPSRMSMYLKDKRETMVAFQHPDDDFLFGLLYINKFGAYVRLDESWMAVPPNDDTFDETYPYMVNPDSVDAFIAAWDTKPISVEEAEQQNWVTAPENEGQQSEPEPESEGEEPAPDTDTTEEDTDD